MRRDYGWCKSAADGLTGSVNDLGETWEKGRGRGGFLVLAWSVLVLWAWLPNGWGL